MTNHNLTIPNKTIQKTSKTPTISINKIVENNIAFNTKPKSKPYTWPLHSLYKTQLL